VLCTLHCPAYALWLLHNQFTTLGQPSGPSLSRDGSFILQKLQQQRSSKPSSSISIHDNPLATSIVLAIQGVSRKERQKAISDGMESSEFQKGQYLCTGYDLYTTHEPTVFEAMALLHSRIRRVVYGCSYLQHGGGIKDMKIHTLPSTNHHYRAFACQPSSPLHEQCERIN
jgi:tRNA(Arg) A34 adenosine deaminase TadA